MHEGIKNIYDLLDAKRLKEALVQLEAICTPIGNWQLRNRIEMLNTSYRFMLQYASQGTQDPNRKDIYISLLRQAYELTQWADIALQTSPSNKQPLDTYPNLQLRLEAYSEDIATVELLYADEQSRLKETEKIYQHHELALDETFNKIWTNLSWNESEYEEVIQILCSILVSSNDKAVIVSAITLSLLQIFDEKKVRCLLEAYHSEDKQTSQRALVGLIIIADIYRHRIGFYPNLTASFSLLNDNDSFCNDLFTIQMQLLLTRETFKIEKKMREEIIPDMMKNPKFKKGKIDLEIKEDEEDRNPEWEEWIDKTGIGEKMKEIADLQMEGADVYMGTFAMLKNYPFFNKMSHWFYPFDLNHSELTPIAKEFGKNSYSILSMILNSNTFCNSDKYSLCLTFVQMSKSSQPYNLQQLTRQLEMSEEQKSLAKDIMTHRQESKHISRQYIQDLFRFFKLRKQQDTPNDIFQSSFNLWENPWLGVSLLQNDRMKELADFLFQKDHRKDAYDLYLRLTNQGGESAEVYQKMGYILQKEKTYVSAINHYERADILSPDNIWTLKHLAQCHKLRRSYNDALKYYLRIEQALPDDLNTSLQIGECHVKMKQYNDALPYLYKVEYLQKNPVNARRAIAWCSFCIGKYEEALKYYQPLLQENTVLRQDWLNAGHVYMAMHQIPEAVHYYAKAQESCKSHSEFLDMFYEDKEELQRIGITEEDIQIILDLLV